MSKFFIGFIATFIILSALIASGFFYINKYNARQKELANLKRSDISITFIEGTRREEMALILDQKGICKYDAFMGNTTNLEGYLFPDTYRFYENTPASEVVTKMLTNFQDKIKTLNVTPSKDQLILASIVEREAALDEDRSSIAGVYQNRLNINMKLDADPTVQYARDNNKLGIDESTVADFGTVSGYKFWTPINQSDYKGVISPYNTYLQNNLPPTPICNPGLKSIRAAVAPAEHGYLYFFTRNKKAIFSKTLEEHEGKL